MPSSAHHKIYPVATSDFAALTQLWERSVRATHDFLSEDDIAFFRPLIEHDYLPMVRLFCTKDEQGQITGFIGVAEHKVEMLFIDPDTRGKGLGKALLHYAITQLNINAVDVNEQNPQAVGFYLKQGFEVKHRSPVDGLGKPYPLLHLALKTGF